MSDHLSRDVRRRSKRRKGDTAKLAAQLAPLEEQKGRAKESNGDGSNHNHAVAHQEVGAIVVEGPAGGLANELAEVQESDRRRRIEPVVVVIFVLALGFIAYIAWQVSLMPAPPGP
jgi:hypothetical protein